MFSARVRRWRFGLLGPGLLQPSQFRRTPVYTRSPYHHKGSFGSAFRIPSVA